MLLILQTNDLLAQKKSSECIYDSTTINAEFIKLISIDSYNWNDVTKEAKIITKQGDFLYIRKWACVTRGTLARLIVLGEYEPIENNFIKWKSKVLQSGKEVLSQMAYIELNNHLQDDKLVAERVGTDLVFNIKSKTLKKFVVVISPLDKMVVINYLAYD